MADRMVHLNGRLVPASEAAISVFDVGFLHAASVFTTMLAHRGRVFRLERHLARLAENARAIELQVAFEPDALAAAVEETVRANELAEARVRVTLSPGPAPAEDRPAEPTTLVTAAPFANPDRWYSEGLGVLVSRYRQFRGDPTAGVKTGNYLARMLARRQAAEAGLDDALWFTDDGRLAEGCFSNIFLVRSGQVATPPLDTPVLPGVVREAVIELCGKLEIACADDEPLIIDDLLAAEEVFLTSSVAGVRPVVRIERHAVGEETPGPVYQRIQEAYRELLDAECAGR